MTGTRMSNETIHIDQLSCEDCGCEFFKMYLTETAIYVPVCCDCGESMIALPAPVVNANDV